MIEITETGLCVCPGLQFHSTEAKIGRAVRRTSLGDISLLGRLEEMCVQQRASD